MDAITRIGLAREIESPEIRDAMEKRVALIPADAAAPVCGPPATN